MTLILAKTIKGKGFSVSENNDWHHTPISNSLFEKFKKSYQLDKILEKNKKVWSLVGLRGSFGLICNELLKKIKTFI